GVMAGERWAESLTYAEDLVAPESDVQRWIRHEMEARGFPMIQVSALEGRLLGFFCAAVGAERILEVGTLGGYSALWLLSLVPDSARLVTLEINPDHAALAAEAFFAARVSDRVDQRLGPAADLLQDLAAEPTFDAVFLDADKVSYPRYLELCTPLIRPGGLLIADNVFWDGKMVEPSENDDASTAGVREFNRQLAVDVRYDTCIVPVRDGLAVARKR
ncbi:MAG: O-methyltransferase, partial [Gemmatimonadota bacterium]